MPQVYLEEIVPVEGGRPASRRVKSFGNGPYRHICVIKRDSMLLHINAKYHLKINSCKFSFYDDRVLGRRPTDVT